MKFERSSEANATSRKAPRRRRKVLHSTQDDKMKALRAALEEGEASGDFRPLDFKIFIAAKRAKSS